MQNAVALLAEGLSARLAADQAWCPPVVVIVAQRRLIHQKGDSVDEHNKKLNHKTYVHETP